jgi:hypothetical protein
MTHDAHGIFLGPAKRRINQPTEEQVVARERLGHERATKPLKRKSTVVGMALSRPPGTRLGTRAKPSWVGFVEADFA